MNDPEAFLRTIEAGLPFEDSERAEILEELRAHLDDSTTELQGEGLPLDLARRNALARLGPPEQLARDLTQARRSTRRLMAAAGAGSWAVVTGGLYGAIVGVLLAAAAWLATVSFVRFVGPFAFDSVSFLGLAVGVYVAGSAVTPAVAARAGYRAEMVQRILAVGGALILAAYALVGWSGPLDLVAVVAVLSLPLWWIAGTTRRSRFGRGQWRAFGAFFLIAAMVVVSTQVAEMALRNPADSNPRVGDGDLGLSRIAAPALEPITLLITGTGQLSADGTAGTSAGAIFADVSDATELAAWTDLRVEAWRAEDPGSFSPTPVSPDTTAPFAVGPAAWSPPGQLPGGAMTWSGNPWWPNAMTLSGTVRLDRTPWITAAWVAMTGVAPDGTRHLILEPQYVEATFNGTTLQWLQAVIGGP